MKSCGVFFFYHHYLLAGYLIFDLLYPDWKKSKLFGSAPPDMIDFMTKRLKGYHNHYKALTMKVPTETVKQT